MTVPESLHSPSREEMTPKKVVSWIEDRCALAKKKRKRRHHQQDLLVLLKAQRVQLQLDPPVLGDQQQLKQRLRLLLQLALLLQPVLQHLAEVPPHSIVEQASEHLFLRVQQHLQLLKLKRRTREVKTAGVSQETRDQRKLPEAPQGTPEVALLQEAASESDECVFGIPCFNSINECVHV